EDDIEIERFLRAIDEAIWENHSRDSGLPLILCAIDKYQGLFRKFSHNPNLAREGIALHPERMPIERLHQEAWRIIEPYYKQQLDKIIEEFNRARSQMQGSDDIPQVAEAAAFSRVAQLLVDADKQVGGKLDPTSGHIQFGDLSQPELDDVLDDIAEKVLKTGGRVLVLPHEQMPTETGLAAIYRF